MTIYLVLQGILMGLVIAVPVGPLGLLCVNRALMLGAVYGLFSGLGVATADRLATWTKVLSGDGRPRSCPAARALRRPRTDA